MTATEELRRLLDERGEEHFDGTEVTLWGYEPTSESTGAYRYSADEQRGMLSVHLWCKTPAQAIAATLGPENMRTEGGGRMRMKFEDGKAYAVVTLRDVFERCEVSDEDEPILAEIKRVYEENAKLREILKSLMMGTYAELCAGRDESGCKECSMYHGEDECTVANAMELLGIDMYGEPLGIEVDE